MRANLLAPFLLLTLPALAITTALPAGADEIPGSAFTSGNWAGAAETDANGAFLDCYAYVTYGSGEQFYISLYGDDTVTVYLTQTGVTFTPGQNYPASMMIEIGYPIVGTAYAASDTFIAFSLNGLDDSLDYFSQGFYFRLLGVGIDQALDIHGIGGALAQARACLVTHNTAVASAAATPAPAGKPALGSSGAGGKPVQMSKPMGTAAPLAPPARAPAN